MILIIKGRWYGQEGAGPESSSQVYYYGLSWAPGTTPQQLTNDSWFHWDVKINNQGQVVWYQRPTEYSDWWLSEIYYYNISWLSDPTKTPRNISNQPDYDVHPRINDRGQVVWLLSHYPSPGQEIYYSDLSWAPNTFPQNISNTPDREGYFRLNNRGQIVWTKVDTWPMDMYYYDLSWTPGTAQYLAGGLNPYSSWDGWKMNDLGQVIWVSGTSGDGGGQIYLATPFTWSHHDIKPAAEPNSINLGSSGKVPVAILSSPIFDARTVDPASVTLAGAQVALKGKGNKYMAAVSDINGDALPDLIVQVDTTAFQLSAGDTEAVLEGKTNDGLCIKGMDTVRIVP
jgi:hypothetical protein